MGQLQASIQLLVDYSDKDSGTQKLADLPAVERQNFLTSCSEEIYGNNLGDFVLLSQSPPFRPVLTHETGTISPSLLDVNAAITAAIVAYNEGGFPLKFDTSFEAAPEDQAAMQEYACIQWVWINGEWVKRYNYDLTAINGNPPSSGALTASYRVTLSHST